MIPSVVEKGDFYAFTDPFWPFFSSNKPMAMNLCGSDSRTYSSTVTPLFRRVQNGIIIEHGVQSTNLRDFGKHCDKPRLSWSLITLSRQKSYP